MALHYKPQRNGKSRDDRSYLVTVGGWIMDSRLGARGSALVARQDHALGFRREACRLRLV